MSTGSDSGGPFPETRWSLVLAAPGTSEPGRAALEELARAYWRPVCAYVRARWAKNEADALDLTQDFFLWMLESGFLDRADPERGRFRGFLKRSLERFLIDAERRRRAQKRGGERRFVPVSAPGAAGTHGLDLADPAGRAPEELLDDAWRAELVERALAGLAAELAAAGHERRLAIFRDYYLGDEVLDYVRVAERHGVKPGDVSNHLMQAKKRFREHLRRAVLETVGSAADLETELAWLFDGRVP